MDFHRAIKFLYPDAQFAVGETYESLLWYSSDITKPSEQELIDANVKALEEREKIAYLKDKDYPDISEKVDALLEAVYSLDNGATAALDEVMKRMTNVQAKYADAVKSVV